MIQHLPLSFKGFFFDVEEKQVRSVNFFILVRQHDPEYTVEYLELPLTMIVYLTISSFSGIVSMFIYEKNPLKKALVSVSTHVQCLDTIALRARRWLTTADPHQQRQILNLLDIQIHLTDRDHYQITGSIPTTDPGLYTTTLSPGPG